MGVRLRGGKARGAACRGSVPLWAAGMASGLSRCVWKEGEAQENAGTEYVGASQLSGRLDNP